MQQHLDPPRALLDRSLFHRILETLPLHSLEEDGRSVTAGVGEDRLATWREQLRYELGEGSGVLTLVEDVRGENEVEGTHTPDVRRAPVEKDRIGFPIQVSAGVVSREVEGRFVMVRREYSRAAGERKDGGKPNATSELDGTGSRKIAF